MRDSKRLQVVERVADEHERQRATSLAVSERRVAECEAKLAELEGYHAGYARDFAQLAAGGMGGARLREFQAFLTRLDEAVRQQREMLARARVERDGERRGWQHAAQRAEIVGQVVTRRQSEERRAAERQEQREADERAEQRAARRLHARGT
jgi:flagellar FliJ protein